MCFYIKARNLHDYFIDLSLGKDAVEVSQDNNEKHDIKNKELQILDR
jgi:hypothetical protein